MFVFQYIFPSRKRSPSRLAKIMVPLRPAAAGNAHPRCILIFESPQVHQKRGHPVGDLFFGGLEGIRTLAPHNANVVRSQLRYKPICRGFNAAKLYFCFSPLSSLVYHQVIYKNLLIGYTTFLARHQLPPFFVANVQSYESKVCGLLATPPICFALYSIGKFLLIFK